MKKTNLFILIASGIILFYLFKKNKIKKQLKSFQVVLKTSKTINVRKGPDVNSEILTTFMNGAIFDAEIFDDNWVKIDLPSGETGYISRLYLIEI